MILTKDSFSRMYTLLLRSIDMRSSSEILVLCACDVDSLCCLRILTLIFQAGDIVFRKKPVRVLEDLIQTDKEIASSSSKPTNIVLINCGGSVSIDEVMPNIPETTMIFVIDSHRPYNNDNVLDNNNIILLGGEDHKDFDGDNGDDDDDDDEQEGDSDDDDEGQPKRKRRRLPTLDDLSSFYGTSAAVIGYQIAEKIQKQNNFDILWWTIIGFTDQFVHQKITQEKFKGRKQ